MKARTTIAAWHWGHSRASRENTRLSNYAHFRCARRRRGGVEQEVACWPAAGGPVAFTAEAGASSGSPADGWAGGCGRRFLHRERLARRVRNLRTEAEVHKAKILDLVKSWRPDLLELVGVGPIAAATILIVWSHPGRIRNEAAFAMIAGAAPIPASSGLIARYRLNRRGDRNLNSAIHIITIHRQRHDSRTQDYFERRRAEGKSDRELRRCLKRYIARELYRVLEEPLDNQ